MLGILRNHVISVFNPLKLSIRTRYHADKIANGRLVRRYGYKEKIKTEGLMPRHKDFGRVVEIPIYRPKNVWQEKRALFGQNDYIDILGDNNLHPTRILYNLPSWIRGFNGNVLQTCIRKRKVFIRTNRPITRPTKWRELIKNIHFLYKYYNRYTKTGYNQNY